MIYIVFVILQVFVGGWFIRDVIRHYNEKEYFMCGVNVMLTVWLIIGMILCLMEVQM